jgi:hypothetical protein
VNEKSRDGSHTVKIAVHLSLKLLGDTVTRVRRVGAVFWQAWLGHGKICEARSHGGGGE